MNKQEDMVARLRNILKWVTKNNWQNEAKTANPKRLRIINQFNQKL